MEIVDDLPRVVGVEVSWSKCCDRWKSITIGVDRSVQEGSGRLDLMLRPSTRHSRSRISVSRDIEEDLGTQRSSLLSRPTKGRTTVSGVVIGIQGKSGNRPEDQRVHK